MVVQMQTSRQEKRAATVTLTEEHLRKIIDNHPLEEKEIEDPVKTARTIQKLVDSGLGLAEKTSWHDWDEWAKGLE